MRILWREDDWPIDKLISQTIYFGLIRLSWGGGVGWNTVNHLILNLFDEMDAPRSSPPPQQCARATLCMRAGNSAGVQPDVLVAHRGLGD